MEELRSKNYLSVISERTVQASDEPFLFSLFVCSRPDLVWVTDMEHTAKEQLLIQQFKLQEYMYKVQNPEAVFQIILLKNIPIGQCYVSYGKTSIKIIAIALIPEYRSKGIGEYIITNLFHEASASNRNVYLEVAWYNDRARSLYERLGFKIQKNYGAVCELQYSPDQVVKLNNIPATTQ